MYTYTPSAKEMSYTVTVSITVKKNLVWTFYTAIIITKGTDSSDFHLSENVFKKLFMGCQK
jgi:hypothetical protein